MAAITSSTNSNGDTLSPYRLNIDQTLRASTALLQHVKEEAQRLQKLSTKKDLLADDNSDNSESEDPALDDEPIWLNITTKKHIADKNRMKPGKIVVPHPLYTAQSLRICLITADPQRAVKNALAEPLFPTELSSRITKVIGYSKLKARYHTFESRRQLLSEHDVFLADDRIIGRLVETLGKIFYKSSAKRPIPIRIAHVDKVDGKVVKKDKKLTKGLPPSSAVASPTIIAKEIQSTLNTIPVSLNPGTSMAVRVGRASFTPQQLSDNVNAVALALIEKYVAKQWRNLKSVHIKSQRSIALPIWLADDMWVDDDDVVDGTVEAEKKKLIADQKAAGKKRKSIGDEAPGISSKKVKGADSTSKDEDRASAAARKAKLLQQKSQALADGLE